MKAIQIDRLGGPEVMELRERPQPELQPGTIIIRNHVITVNFGDIFFNRGEYIVKPVFPDTPGMEAAGIVDAVAPDVNEFKPGMRVAYIGMGAYADYLLVPDHVVAHNMFLKPDHLPFEEAALLEPLACVVHAHETSQPQSFETVLIIGAGAFGLLHLLMLKATGIREVVVAGRGAGRLRCAGELGADLVIDAAAVDAEAAVARLNDGHGPDLVIECTGHIAGWRDAFTRVRRGGRVVFFGGCPAGTALSVDTRRMHYDNLTLLAPFHFRPRDVRRACELLSDRVLGAGRIINARRPLSELAQVFTLLEQGYALKCAVIP